MGLEYPVIAIMTSVAFLVVILSSLFLYLHVTNELEKVPVLNGDVEVYSVACNFTRCVRLILAVSNERGDPVELVQIRVYADKGTLTIDFPSTVSNNEAAQSVTVYGLVNGKVLPRGATAYIVIDVPQTYFTTGKTYQVMILFDKCPLILSFDVK